MLQSLAAVHLPCLSVPLLGACSTYEGSVLTEQTHFHTIQIRELLGQSWFVRTRLSVCLPLSLTADSICSTQASNVKVKAPLMRNTRTSFWIQKISPCFTNYCLLSLMQHGCSHLCSGMTQLKEILNQCKV